MKKLALAAICVTILMLGGCAQTMTAPAKPTADTTRPAQTQPATSNPTPDAGPERGGAGGY